MISKEKKNSKKYPRWNNVQQHLETTGFRKNREWVPTKQRLQCKPFWVAVLHQFISLFNGHVNLLGVWFKTLSDSESLSWGLRFCIFNRLSGDASASGPWATPGIAKLYDWITLPSTCQSINTFFGTMSSGLSSVGESQALGSNPWWSEMELM